MNFLEKLMHQSGTTKVPRYAKEGFGFRAIVTASSEFRRIDSLPRRTWEAEAEHFQKVLTDEFRTLAGKMTLRIVQAVAIAEAVLYGGAFCPIGVGGGKALISLLAPLAMDSKRPLLVVPAQLREQTNRFVIPQMKQHWKLHPNLRVIGYSELSLEKNAQMLEEYRPDLIILDECHRLKNKKAGRTRRVLRYFKEHPETRCVAMSGTVSSRSIKDYAHIIEWCLGGGSPVPLRWQELTEWADCVDTKVPDDRRVGPGALRKWCDEGENVRQGFRRRLVQTPGVIASKEGALGTSLQILQFGRLIIPVRIQFEIDKMRNTWETPNGDIITEAVELWRHIRELALGFYYRWDPPAPRDWLDARRAWKSCVRGTLKVSKDFDTELQVWNAAKNKNSLLGYNFVPVYDAWKAWSKIKDTFKPNPVAEWLDDFALRACGQWLNQSVWKENDKRIVWVEHRAFGEALAKRGWDYFGAGDNRILDTQQTAIVASIAAHGEGKNLERFSKNLIVSPPASGKVWEQVLGRTHRPGQEADEVTCEVFLDVPECRESFEQARRDAKYLEDSLGNVQKLNYADIVVKEVL
jgi:hypothetical protein